VNNSEFYLKQQAAVQRMREMSSQAKIKNDAVQKKSAQTPQVNNSSFSSEFTIKSQSHIPESSSSGGTARSSSETTKSYQNKLNIPFLDSLFRDGDSTIIIGLLLILMSEKSDKLLLFALIYILM
jgi:hypothetical protein